MQENKTGSSQSFSWDNLGPAIDRTSEGAYRRGYHQAVAEIAHKLKHGFLTAAHLEAWVEGKGMSWRKDTSLENKIAPPDLA